MTCNVSKKNLKIFSGLNLGLFKMTLSFLHQYEVKFYDQDMHNIDQCLISIQPEGFGMNRPGY